MNGFGFIEYKDPMDARDVVPGLSLAPLQARGNDLLTTPRIHSLPYVTDFLVFYFPPFWLTPRQDGSDFMGERLTVQFARGSRHRDGAPGGPGGGFGNQERAPPRPRRTQHRMQITGLPSDTSWQVCSPSPFLLSGLPWILPVFPSLSRRALVFLHPRHGRPGACTQPKTAF